MARPLRIEFDGAWYHVMNRGAGRRTVFRSAAHRTLFFGLLGEISKVYGVEVHAYCLMRNHYHLLLHTPRAGLARAMRHLDGVYTQRFNRSSRTDGPLFRGRYRSELIGEDPYLCCVSRYIHLNPVDAKLVTRPEDHLASSYRAYVGLCEAEAWLHTAETLSRFGPGDARENYRRFVMAGVDSDTRVFYARARRRPVLGSEEFRRRVERRVRATRVHEDPERPDSRLLLQRPTLDRIAAAVCRAFGVSPANLRAAFRRQDGRGAARGAFVLLGREAGGLPLAEVAAWIGYRSYAAASKAMHNLRDEIERRPDTRDRVESARRELHLATGTLRKSQAKTRPLQSPTRLP